MANIHQLDTLSQVAALLDTGKYSDFTIRCEAREFKVHKNIVCLQSPVFAAQFEHAMKENLTGVIDHETFGADTIKCVIDYIYKKEYSVTLEEAEDSGASEAYASTYASDKAQSQAALLNAVGGVAALSLGKDDGNESSGHDSEPSATNFILIEHLKIYAAADYYDLPYLQKMAREKFTTLITNAFQVTGFADVVNVGYQLVVDDQMKEVLLDQALKHAMKLIGSDEFLLAVSSGQDLQAFAFQFVRQSTLQQEKKLNKKETETKRLKSDLASADDTIADLVRTYTAEIATHKTEKDVILDQMEKERVHREAVNDDLIKSIKEVPAYCRNVGCAMEYADVSSLKFEPRGYNHMGPTHWVVRCSCKCKLVNRGAVNT